MEPLHDARRKMTRRGRGRRWFRALMSLLLVCGLIAVVDLREAGARIRSADPHALAVALALMLLTQPLMAWRWQRMLAHDGLAFRFLPLVRIYVESSFFGLFLPSAIGGDVFRATEIHELMGGLQRTSVNLLTERLIGVWSVCLLALWAVIYSRPPNAHIRWTVLLVLAGVGVVSALAMSRHAQRILNRSLTWLGSERLVQVHRNTYEQFHGYVRRPWWLTKLIVLSMALQLLMVLSLMFTARAVGVERGLGLFLTIMPVVWLLGLVPALGGVGPREAGLAYFLAAAGVDNETAIAASALALAVTIAKGLLGAAVFLLRSVSPR
jgi:hypothetical protein